MKKLWSFVAILIFLTSCTVQEPHALADWIGEYEYRVPPRITNYYSYQMTIYQQEEELYADITHEGRQAGSQLRGKVQGDAESIEITFLEYLFIPNFPYGYREGEPLLRLNRINGEIHTQWLELGCPFEDEPDLADTVTTKLEPVPARIDTAQNELLSKHPSPIGEYIAYYYTSYNAELDEMLYLVSVLPAKTRFAYPPANAFAATMPPVEISWRDPDNPLWDGREMLEINMSGIPLTEVKKSRKLFEKVDIHVYTRGELPD